MKKIKFNFILFFNLVVFINSFIIEHHKKPVIGMYGLVEPISDYEKYTKEAIDGGFVRWLEASGAEVAVIHIWYTHEQIISLLNQINGVLFSAGPRRPLKYDEPWELKAKYIFDYARNNGIPIWGTCLGMQMITKFMADDNKPLDKYDNIGLKKVELTNLAKESNLLSLFKEKDYDNLNNSETSFHIHKHGISPESFYSNKNLVENYDIQYYFINFANILLISI